jgi:acyl-CoA reductase-like NAD-dependent aldehyde dehydrogenase
MPTATVQHLIDGHDVPSLSGATFESLDPATGAPLGTVSFGDESDVDRAVRSAATAFDDGRWYHLAPEAGIIWTNCPNHGQWNVPYEGHKLSGLGEDKGLESIDTFTQLKTHHVNFGGHRSRWA